MILSVQSQNGDVRRNDADDDDDDVMNMNRFRGVEKWKRLMASHLSNIKKFLIILFNNAETFKYI